MPEVVSWAISSLTLLRWNNIRPFTIETCLQDLQKCASGKVRGWTDASKQPKGTYDILEILVHMLLAPHGEQLLLQCHQWVMSQGVQRGLCHFSGRTRYASRRNDILVWLKSLQRKDIMLPFSREVRFSCY
jgi:hypothetical protein